MLVQHLTTANMLSCLLTTTVFLLAFAKSPVVDACSVPIGWRSLTTEELIDGAREVLFGRVGRTFPDDSGRPWSQYLYSAEVEVYCIMKGQRTPRRVNITDVGMFRAWPPTSNE